VRSLLRSETHVRDLLTFHRVAREIFSGTLKSVDAGDAVRRAVHLKGSQLQIVNTTFNLADHPRGVSAVAIGKAARPMAAALTEILGSNLTAGVITAPSHTADCGLRIADLEKASSSFPIRNPQSAINNLSLSLSEHWRVFAGGHPLPNSESLAAARAAFDLLKRADENRAPVIFLISGGGSAMLEWPRDESITLEEIRATNDALISCGAAITEINAVRRAISAVKGGGLAARAPRCDQVSLIVSDTGAGQEATVASGPTFDSPADTPDALSVIARYELETRLPASIQRAIKQSARRKSLSTQHALREYFVLLDNESAIESAAEAARARGFVVEIAPDIIEQPIAEGCSLLLSRLLDLRRRVGTGRPVCLISGGEFACPVRGRGSGGRNSESALRWAISLDALRQDQSNHPHIVTLSAGTDGIDGNSPAAGAVADETSVERARALHLDARRFLDESDAYAFFHALGDTIMTGATGTNVRDLRIMLAS
jgi:glycerate 2-kinase